MKRLIRGVSHSVALLVLFGRPGIAADGATVFQQTCASCHESASNRAPGRDALQAMSPENVLSAMESGSMVSIALNLPAVDRRAVAEYVTAKTLAQSLNLNPPSEAMCSQTPDTSFNPLAGPRWNGWGVNASNTRFQDEATAGVTAADVPRLKLKWAFGFPGDLSADAHPTIAGGRVFVGSHSGNIYALGAETGCVHWFFKAAGPIRGAVTIAPVETRGGRRYAAFIGDAAANVHALDAATGKLLWTQKVDDFPGAKITGSPTFHDGRIYIGLTAMEEVTGAVSSYECCRFRGSLVALNATTGARAWKTYTIAEDPRPTSRNKVGTQMWGPSGAPIWTSPTIDVRRRRIYVTTGDNYSDPPTSTSDAVIAFDLASGRRLWSRQMTTGDAWNVACSAPDTSNCPASKGPDVDFASPPILLNLSNDRRVLIASQKSGIVHALDPDRDGEILWQTRVGKGGTMGGVQWGAAADQSNVYVALSDIGLIAIPNSTGLDPDPNVGGGMFALRLEDGSRIWHTPPAACGDRKRCSPAQSAAVSAIPGVAFSGSVDGHLRAFSARDGAILWDVDTVRPYETVNKVPARGGSLNGPGPAIAGGMLVVNSGYAITGIPGNVLLAFTVDGR